MEAKVLAAAAAALIGLGTANAIAAGETPVGESKTQRSVADSTWIKSSARHSRFTVFTENGQVADPMVQQSGHGTMRAISGTVISTEGTPMLHNGCIKVDCDKGNVTIGTRVFQVTVPDGGSALIESFPAIRSFRVVALKAPQNDAVTVRYKQARLPVRLGAGEMVATEGDHPTSTTKFDPKTFVQPVPEDQPLIEGADSGSQPSRIYAIQATQFKCMSSGAVAIREGECLISTGSALTALGPTAEAVAKKNALIDIEAYTGDFRVKSLSGPGHVSVQEGEDTLPLHPGQEIFVAKRVVEDSDKTPPDGVGRRKFTDLLLKDGTKAIMSDYSIMSFLAVEHLLALRRSSDPKDRDIVERILKTAAAVQSLTASSGMYTAVPRAPRKIRRESGPSA